MSSSSREVTGKKKKDVWQEAGGEFYQEQYPCGSGQATSTADLTENTTQRRSSRHHIPLPSQTARRNSFMPTGRKYYTRKQSLNLNANATVTTTNCMTYTSTMAGGANGGNEVHVALMPDLADETIPNEKSTYEALMKIKALPEPMSHKRLRKAKITAIPKLRLRGWRMIKWEFKRGCAALRNFWTRQIRNTYIFQHSLQQIEGCCGTSIVNIFLFIKWTLFLNLFISLVVIFFILIPFFFVYQPTATKIIACPNDDNPGDDFFNLTESGVIKCCIKKYHEDLANNTRGSMGDIVRLTFGSKSTIETTPFFYGYYIANDTDSYDVFAITYALVYVVILIFCLVLMVGNIGIGVKEMIIAGEGEFYKYSNLIFAGWDYYTQDKAGAAFKRKILNHEMKIALQTEKQNLESLIRSRKQRIKLSFIRIFVNLLVVMMLAGAGVSIYHIADVSLVLVQGTTSFASTTISEHLENQAYSFAPSIVITFYNLIFPIMLAKIGKFEQYSAEKETALVLIRALFVRLMAIGFAAVKYYGVGYCYLDGKNYCTQCINDETKHRKACWESFFADQIYRLIFTDIIVKLILTFIVDPIRKLMKRCCKNKLCERIGTLKFNIVRHSLDMIYLQVLSWLGMYFAPFIPIVSVVYCFMVFYIKKYSVLYNCTAVPNTFKTIRTTTIFVAAKLLSFIAVAFTNVAVLGFMMPSRGCGPFRKYEKPWKAVMKLIETSPIAEKIYGHIASPGLTTPIAIILVLLAYYYYSVAQANRGMVETLRHLLILEGHDKQYLFARLNSLRRTSSNRTSTRETMN